MTCCSFIKSQVLIVMLEHFKCDEYCIDMYQVTLFTPSTVGLVKDTPNFLSLRRELNLKHPVRVSDVRRTVIHVQGEDPHVTNTALPLALVME